MLCLTVLLAFQTPLPEVGSPAAQEADTAYRAWVESISMPPITPVHVEYAISATMGFLDDGHDVELSLDCEVQVDFESLHRYRLQVRGTAGMDSQVQVDFQGEALFDGKTIWLHGQIDSKELELQEQGMIRCDQEMLENGYLQMIAFLPRLAENPEAQDLGFDKLFLTVGELMPPDLGTYLHPAGYMYSAAKSFTCRRFHEAGDILDLDLSADARPGSPLGAIFEVVEDLEVDESFTETDKAEFEMLKMFADQVSLHLRQDRATGIPLALETSFAIDPGMLDAEDVEGPIQVTMTMLGSMETPESIDASLFAAPPASDQALDVTPFLQLGLNSLEQAFEELDSEQDMEF